MLPVTRHTHRRPGTPGRRFADAVDAMFEFRLGREARDADKEAIVAFVRTLAGPIPKESSP